ncbi:MAG: TonB family protein [candidate division Zixibacteria bacterium]|nr:TonB family protein [candidate division Zixibacteria bacterium]MDH3938606.1 TonB family protein [candidate division Zixibacteria bacterium]MDH4033895.1 TonB family protein [candidate division Zixibacteria bacterium]
MARDLLLSVALHVGIVAFTLLASPFESESQFDDREVISVDLLFEAPPGGIEVQEEPPPDPVTVATPKTVEDEPEEIPISEPVTDDEEVIIDEESQPEETETKEEPPPEDQTVVQPPPADVTAANEPAVAEGPAEIHSTVTGKGTVFAGATISNANFDYPYWFTQTFNKILRNWRNPVASDGVIVCAIYFEVIKSGRVIVKRIETSSGIAPFDAACLAAVDRANPFPPLPRQFADEIIGITLPFKYDPSR